MIRDSQRLLEASGGPAGFAAALKEMNAVLRAHGLGDVYLVAVGDRRGLAEAGFSGITGWGFAFRDAVRATFTSAPAAHVDLVPNPARIAAFSVLKGDELARARAVEKEPYPDPPVSRRSVTWAMKASPPARCSGARQRSRP